MNTSETAQKSKMPQINVIHVPNPFEPSSRVITSVDWTLGKLVSDYVPEGLDAENAVVNLSHTSGDPDSLWDKSPSPGEAITVVEIPQGSGGNSKSILRVVAFAAISAASAGLAAPAAGALGFTSSFAVGVAQVGISMAGAALVNAILPPPSPLDNASVDDSPSYGVNGAIQTAGQGGAIPLTYGKFRQAGTVVSSYADPILEGGDSQVLNMMIAIGEGDLTDVTDLEINDQPLENFTNLSYAVKLSRDPERVPAKWNLVYSDYEGTETGNLGAPINNGLFTTRSHNITPAHDDWSYVSSVEPVSRLRMDFIAPAFYYTDKNGKFNASEVDMRIQYEVNNSGLWLDVPSNNAQLNGVGGLFHYDYDYIDPSVVNTLEARRVLDKITGVLVSGDTVDWNADPRDGVGVISRTIVWGEGLLAVHRSPGDVNQQTFVVGLAYTDGAEEILDGSLQSDYTTFIGQRASTTRWSITTPRLTADGSLADVRIRMQRRYEDESPNNTDVQETIVLNHTVEIVDRELGYSGTAMLALRIRMDDQLSSVPKITFLNHGRVIGEHDGSNWAQATNNDNPAWICADLLRQEHTGDVPERFYDLNSIRQWAAFCGTNNLKFNGVFDVAGSNLWTNLTTVARAGRANVLPIGTKITFIIEQEYAPSMIFGNGNIIEGSFQSSWLPTSGRANHIDVAYYDEDNDYKETTVRVGESTVPQGKRRVSAVKAFGVTNVEQATREGTLMLNKSKLIRRAVNFETTIEGLAAIPGDHVTVQNDYALWAYSGRTLGVIGSTVTLDQEVDVNGTGWLFSVFVPGTKSFETRNVTQGANLSEIVLSTAIGGMTPNENLNWAIGKTANSGKSFVVTGVEFGSTILSRKISALEYDPNAYRDDTIAAYPDSPSLLNTYIGQVQNLRSYDYYRSEGGSTKGYVQLTWEVPNKGVYDGAKIYHSVNGGRLEQIGVVSAGLTNWSREYSIGDSLFFKVVASSNNGFRAPYSKAPVTQIVVDLQEDILPPYNFRISNETNKVVLSWTNNDIAENDYVEIYRSTTSDVSTARMLDRGRGETYTDYVSGNQPLYYWLTHSRYSNLKSSRSMYIGPQQVFTEGVIAEEIDWDSLSGEGFDAVNQLLRDTLPLDVHSGGISDIRITTGTAPGSIELVGNVFYHPLGRKKFLVNDPVIVQTPFVDGNIQEPFFLMWSQVPATTRFTGWVSDGTTDNHFAVIYDAQLDIWHAIDSTNQRFLFQPDGEDSIIAMGMKKTQETGSGIDTLISYLTSNDNLPEDGATSTHTFVQPNRPLHGDVEGGLRKFDVWFDTSRGKLQHYWNDTNWVVVRDEALTTALSSISQRESLLDGSVDLTVSNTSPSNPKENDFWMLEDHTQPQRWDGNSWVDASGNLVLQAIINASSAEALADGKVKTFFEDSDATVAPVPTALGDLWYQDDTGKTFRSNDGLTWGEVFSDDYSYLPDRSPLPDPNFNLATSGKKTWEQLRTSDYGEVTFEPVGLDGSGACVLTLNTDASLSSGDYEQISVASTQYFPANPNDAYFMSINCRTEGMDISNTSVDTGYGSGVIFYDKNKEEVSRQPRSRLRAQIDNYELQNGPTNDQTVRMDSIAWVRPYLYLYTRFYDAANPVKKVYVTNVDFNRGIKDDALGNNSVTELKSGHTVYDSVAVPALTEKTIYTVLDGNLIDVPEGLSGHYIKARVTLDWTHLIASASVPIIMSLTLSMVVNGVSRVVPRPGRNIFNRRLIEATDTPYEPFQYEYIFDSPDAGSKVGAILDAKMEPEDGVSTASVARFRDVNISLELVKK